MLSTLTQTLLDSLPAARVDVIGLAHEEQHTYWITLTQVERGAAVRRIFDPVHSDECNLVALDQEPERVRSLNHLEVVASLQPCGQHRTTFPIVLPQGATHWGVVEVRSPSALDEQARFTTGALLQLYGNMLEMLDYSERDALTGLWNRKPFDDLFYKALAQPADPELAPGERRNSVGQFWLAMVDIDRGIEYVLVRKHPELPLTDRTVLALYDQNCTNGYDNVEYAEQCAIREALKNAALAVQS